MIRLFEAFAGYGTSSFALKHLGIEHELVGYSEIDKHAIQCFEKNHCNGLYYNTTLNQMKRPINYGDITKIEWNSVPDFDLLTGGFPCQAFSTAGKQQGESDYRGQLGLELTKALQIKQPKYFLFENVKGFMGKKFKSTRDKFIKSWEDAGYIVHSKILNTKDYGIPQNRERVWFVGIRRDVKQDFSFPEPFKLTLKLRDLLDAEVDEKYYLKGGLLAWWERNKEYQLKKMYSSLDSNIAIAQTARQYASWNGNYIQADVSGKGYKSQQDRIYNTEKTICCLPNANPTNKLNVIQPDLKLRRLTPKEAFRAQGFLHDEIDISGISDSALYRLAGNGQSVNVVSLIFKALLK